MTHLDGKEVGQVCTPQFVVVWEKQLVVIINYPYTGIDSHADNELSNPLG